MHNSLREALIRRLAQTCDALNPAGLPNTQYSRYLTWLRGINRQKKNCPLHTFHFGESGVFGAQQATLRELTVFFYPSWSTRSWKRRFCTSLRSMTTATASTEILSRILRMILSWREGLTSGIIFYLFLSVFIFFIGMLSRHLYVLNFCRYVSHSEI